MQSRRQVVELCALCALAPSAAPVAAQQETRSATLPVSLRVLARTTFDGGMFPRAAAVALPAALSHATPEASVYTRMSHDVITRVVVTGAPLRGPGGVVVAARLDCSFEGSAAVSGREPFDCAGGGLARVEDGWRGKRTRADPVAVLAAMRALDTVSAPLGMYASRVVVTATSPAY
ncbi:MAG TPA: hypothetical protein VM033_07365 [Gemmatimonadaceae bacterium]|nr:hypothetical protein [Gemmatimonadaceae bacterium]